MTAPCDRGWIPKVVSYRRSDRDCRSTMVLSTAQDPDELALVIGWLTSEFGGRIDAAAIGRTAREEIMLFDRAKVVTSFRRSRGASPGLA
jgi:hypothetical protein